MNFFSWKKKKKVVILANCQGGVYKSLLKDNSEFTKKYEIIDLPLVHTLTPQDSIKIYNKLKNIDILFYQPLSAQKYKPFFIEKLKAHMPFLSSTISIPVLYFNFYAPHTTYIFSDKLKKFDIDYHDINIILSWYYHLSNETVNLMLHKNDYYSFELLSKISRINFSRLREREKEIDLKYANFLESIYHQSVFFPTFNHPSNEILLDMYSKICKKLKVSNKTKEFNTNLLGNVFVSVYPSIHKFINSKTDDEPTYNIFGKKTLQSEMIEKYYQYYNEHEITIKRYIEENLLKSKDKIEVLLIDNFNNKFNILTK